MIEGACRCGGRGFPEIAKQEEVRGETNLRETIGAVKAAELNIEGIDETIVATSVCDSKPVNFLSSSCNEIRGVKKTKKIWAQEKGCMMDLEFLRLSSADDCNGGMGDVDAADRKRLSCRPDRFMRKMKWWWAIWTWGLGVLLVNCYACHVAHLTSKGVDKKNILSQHEFRKAIALAWLDPKNHWKSNEKKRSSVAIEEPSGINARNKKTKNKESNLH